MDSLSMLLAFYDGNPPVTGGFPSPRRVMQSCDVFFDIGLNKLLSKHSSCMWFLTPLYSCDVTVTRCCRFWFISTTTDYLLHRLSLKCIGVNSMLNFISYWIPLGYHRWSWRRIVTRETYGWGGGGGSPGTRTTRRRCWWRRSHQAYACEIWQSR